MLISKQIFFLALAIISIICTFHGKNYLVSEKNRPARLFVDDQCDSLILWAVRELADDLEAITGKRPSITQCNSLQKYSGIYIGTYQLLGLPARLPLAVYHATRIDVV